jgi:hypothetical protein
MSMAEQLIENSRQGSEAQKPSCIGLESHLSRNTHWGCSHVYDETPVGIAVYVRNDPVNRIDPDGRLDYYSMLAAYAIYSSGRSLAEAMSIIYAMFWYNASLSTTVYVEAEFDPVPLVDAENPISVTPPGPIGPTDPTGPTIPGGPSGGPTPLLDKMQDTKSSLVDILTRNKKCADFIGGNAIGQLNQTKVDYQDLGGWFVDSNGNTVINMEHADHLTIHINSQSPFNNPNTPVTAGGEPFVPLDVFNRDNGVRFNAQQYRELWLLHGLAHITMAPRFSQNDDSYRAVLNNNQLIIQQCFTQ